MNKVSIESYRVTIGFRASSVATVSRYRLVRVVSATPINFQATLLFYGSIVVLHSHTLMTKLAY